MEVKITLGENLVPENHKILLFDDDLTDNNTGIANKQEVNFFYLINQFIKKEDTGTLDFTNIGKKPYTGINGVIVTYSDYGVVLLDYITGGRISGKELEYGISTLPLDQTSGVSIYRREIWYNYDPATNQLDLAPDGEPTYGEPTYHLVADGTNASAIIDYNVGNNRYYEYLYRFVYAGSGVSSTSFKEIKKPIEISWNGWSLSDLHEVEGSNGKEYTTSLNDTWKFKFNISSGQQVQNLSRTEQETLGRFPRFSQGLKNAISGSVQCLLGRDVLPAIYSNSTYTYTQTISDDVISWKWKEDTFGAHRPQNLGGYQENLIPSVQKSYVRSTSNKSVDMLNKWREFCYSGNPKLLRDAKGQRFIVQLMDTSNTTQENWNQRPEEISFSWIQIQDADDATIIEEA